MIKETKIGILIEVIKYSFASIGIYTCVKFLIKSLKTKDYNKNNCDILLENIKEEDVNEEEQEVKEVKEEQDVKEVLSSTTITIKNKLEILEKRMEYIDVVNNRLTNLQIILGDLREKISSKN